jgi:hypothetical protein
LTPGDTDTQLDFYDARVGGGFPAPVPVLSCSVKCPGAGSEASVFGVPGSTSPGVGGNFAGGSAPPPVVGPKPVVVVSRVQKLAKALKACRGKHARKQRVACERQARKRYGPKPKPKSKAMGKNGKSGRVGSRVRGGK